MDLRVQKTERALTEALLTLLKEKPFEEITVSDLCETAMVRRATFYKHFRDKHEFLDFCMTHRLRKLEPPCAVMCAEDPVAYCIDATRDMLRFLQENRVLIDRTAKRPEAAGLMDIFTRQMTRAMLSKADLLSQDGLVFVAKPEVIAGFFTGALLGTVRWWFTECPEMGEDELLAHIKPLLAACLPHILTKKEEQHERQPAKE